MKYTWLTFFISLISVRVFNLIVGHESPYSYAFVAFSCLIVFLLTYVSELKINPRWILLILFPLILQIIGITHILAVSDWGLNLSAETRLPFTIVNPDNYQKFATDFANQGWSSVNLNYALFLGYFYKLFGISSLVGELISVLLYYSSIEVFVKCVRLYNKELIKDKAFKIALIILLMYPQFISESIQIHRELLIIYLFSLSLYYYLSWWLSNNQFFLFLSLALVVPAGVLHGGSIFLSVGIMLCFILYLNNREHIKVSSKSFFYLFLLVICSAFILTKIEISKFDNLDISSIAVERANYTGEGGGGYTAGYSIGNPFLSAIVNTPIKMFYFWFSPLPQNWRGIIDIVTFFISSLLYLIPFVYVLIEKVVGKTINNVAWSIFTTLIVFSIPFSWGVSNSSQAIRHRCKVIIWIAFLIVVLINNRGLRKREFRKSGAV